ncbi:hypothetical protein ACU4HD_46990 [Cupriavidus basilensis]
MAIDLTVFVVDEGTQAHAHPGSRLGPMHGSARVVDQEMDASGVARHIAFAPADALNS